MKEIKRNINRKIRILQFPLAASKGGITQYILNLWRKINKEIIQFDFITFSSKLDFEDELLQKGCKVYHISCYPEINEEQFSKEFKKILNYGYDAIELHTSYWKNTIMEEMAKKYGKCKVILHAHSTGIVANLSSQEIADAKERHYKIRDMIDEKLADEFWACSIEAANWLYGSNVPRKKITIINDTIDTDKFRYNKGIREQKRRELGLADKYVIGHIGRLEKEKNHKFILDIFNKVHMKFPQAVLLLIGEGSYRKAIEAQIAELMIENCVIMTGRKEYISEYLQVMDAFVFPSIFEGFGLSFLEAQCSGLRCLGSTNVPKMVFITKCAERISLDEPDRWVQLLEETAKGYVRESQDLVIKERGYDTAVQIGNYEKMYME